MYKINNFVFDIINHNQIEFPNNITKFETNEEPTYQYDLYVINHIDVEETSFTFTNDIIKICMNNNLEKRYLYLKGADTPYAVTTEIDESHTVIYIREDYMNDMIIDPIFISLLSLERRMAKYQSFILHSSYIVYNEKAILFTAPSGTGKSTQADLWEKYRGARVINGDRTLIVKEEGKYYACGWPVCGSSNICFNEKYPISCIVVLSQGIDNHINILNPSHAFKKILSETTINFHNKKFVNKALDFIDDITQNVNIYHLTCNISENAVTCLENVL